MNDLTGDQKKKFFNDLDAMHTAKHEEVESVEEGSATSRKPFRNINSPEYRAAADKQKKKMKDEKAAEPGKKLLGKIAAKNEEVESVEEELKGDMHPDAHKVLKHIKPEHHGTYKPYLKKGTYKGDYKDRSAVLSAAEKAGHVREEVELDEISQGALKNYFKKAVADLSNRQIKLNTGLGDSNDAKKMQDRRSALSVASAKLASKMEEVELTQEDLDFIASLNQIDEVDQLAIRMGSGGPGFNKTPAGKAREVMRKQEHLKGQMKFTKSQGGIAGPKGKLPEEVELEEDFDLEDFTLEQIEEFMQTEEFSQLDELSKDTLASYIKKRSHDVAAMGAVTRKHAMDSEAKRKEQNYSGARDSNDKSNRAFMKGWKHRENIGKAVDRLTKG